MELVAEGSEIQNLANYEHLFQEGEKGQVQIYLNRELSNSDIEQLTKELTDKGAVMVAPITCESRILTIKFEKRIAPLILIVAAVLGIGVVGWQIFKPSWGAPLGIPLGIWAVGAALLGLLVYMGVKE